MTHHSMCPAATRCTTCGCKRCECDLIHRVLADREPPVTITVQQELHTRYGTVTADIPEEVETVRITADLLRQIVAAINERANAYNEGYNDHARAAQHWRDTHGPYRVPPGSGGMTTDVQMES